MEKRQPTTNADLKLTIFYPREYRRFSKMRANAWVYLLLCVLPVTALFVVFYSPITQVLCQWAGNIVSLATGQQAQLLTGEFLPWFGNVYYLGLEGGMPSFTHALVSAIVCVLGLVILTQINNSSRSLVIYLCMGLFVHLVSSLFFVFIPQLFPYTLTDYSELYIKQQISIWVMVALICGAATALLNSSGIAKVVTFFATVAYSVLYGCIRYVVYLLVVYYFSLMYMASLFFTLGVLFDFLQLVAIYAIFVKHVSGQMSTGRRRAEWLWS